MPVDQTHPSVARAAIDVRPTAAGVVVVAMGVAAALMSSSSRLAVGFMIPLALFIAVDAYLSWHIVSRRSVTVSATRTVADATNGVAVRIVALPARHPLRITISSGLVIEQHLTLHDEPATLELGARHTGALGFVRCKPSSTIFGLAQARRWETHTVSMLHWAPLPQQTDLPVPDAIDEVARLRSYVPGDRLSRVSWPVTARTGQMHVRAPGPGDEEVVVVLNLGSRLPGFLPQQRIVALEQVLQLAASYVGQLLIEGHEVRLITTELTDQYFALELDAARTDPGRMTSSDIPLDVGLVDEVVLDDVDLSRRLARAEMGERKSWPYGPFIEISNAGIQATQ